MRRATATLLAFVFLFGFVDLGVTNVAAQQGNSTLSGTICSQDWQNPYPEDQEYCMGQGLPGATVTLFQAGDGTLLNLGEFSESQTTDEHGWFGFGGLEDGTYEVSIERNGFEQRDTTWTAPGPEWVEWNLQGSQITATGSILGESGPLAGAEVRFDRDRDSIRAVTGEDGRYSVALTAGHYGASVSHLDHHTFRDYGILLDGQGDRDFTLEPAPEKTVKIVGTALDQDGSPVADARVELWQYGYYDCCYDEPYPASPDGDYAHSRPYYQDNYFETTTDSQGRFEAKAYEGWVDLTIWKDGHARYQDGFEVQDGETKTLDIELLRFPDKTAHFTGRVVDAVTGDGLPWASISIESPAYGLYECSTTASDRRAQGDTMEDRPQSSTVAPDIAYYPARDCAITVESDGDFDGMVTPGYSVVRVYYDHWRSCHETRHSDGSLTRTCGQQYFSWSGVMELPADATTKLDIALVPRPGPDAQLQGYVVDDETGNAIPGVQVSINNQDNYGWASAETDDDGSYAVKLRSGYLQVSVWAEGYHRWEGVVSVAPDDTMDFDIHLTPGRDQYGYCCHGHYPVYEEVAYADSYESDGNAHSTSPSSGAPSPPRVADEGEVVQESGATSKDFQDLGGGLGPYRASQRTGAEAGVPQEKEAPGFGFALVGLALVALALARRR